MRGRPKACKAFIGMVLVILSSACERKNVEPRGSAHQPASLTDQQILNINAKKVFFGHQSVGNDIVQGIRDIESTDPRLRLKIVKSGAPEVVPGPALVEFEIGSNGNTVSKNEDFLAILDKGFGQQGGVAIFKYCYADFDSTTDVPGVFDVYQREIAAVRSKYPLLRMVHVTVPLTTVESASKAWIKERLGRPTRRDMNEKRNQFNKLLRTAYSGIDVIFDLAEVESTASNGQRVYFGRNGETIYSLAPEFTSDGGHLNANGRRIAAERMLSSIALID